MGRLARKTTILFDPEEYEQLKRSARLRRCSVGELIRSTLREKNLLSNDEQRVRAATELAAMQLPVSSWEELEEETISGATE